ncbi:hypothetical protein HK101_011806, partial [Irineochytrium annulatum]
NIRAGVEEEANGDGGAEGILLITLLRLRVISTMIIRDCVMDLRRQIERSATSGACTNGETHAAATETKKFKWTEELRMALWNLQAMEIEVQELLAQYKSALLYQHF